MLTLTSAVAVLNEDLCRILLIKRDAEPFQGLLGLPGGKIESQEGFWTAAKRELHEEIGLTAPSWVLTGAFHTPGVLMIVFAARCEEAPRRLQDGFWYEISDLPHLDLAPNVYEAVHAARRAFSSNSVIPMVKVAAEAAAFTAEQIRSSIRTSLSNAGILDVGWDQFLERRRVGTIGTALGFLALEAARMRLPPPEIDKIVETLLRRENHETGGWGIKSMEAVGSPSIVESTCYVLRALRSAGLTTNDEPIRRGIVWLLGNQGNGGWGTTSGLPARLLPTTLAMEALTSCHDDESVSALRRATEFVVRAQNQDGGWGIRPVSRGSPEETSTAPHTARAISALIRCGYPLRDQPIQDGLEWLRLSIQNWNEVGEIEYLGDHEADRQRLDFKHTAHPLVLRAFLDTGLEPSDPIAIATIARIARQTTSEHSGAFGGTPIWAAYDRVEILSRFVAVGIPTSFVFAENQLRTADEALTTLGRFYQTQLTVAISKHREAVPTREDLFIAVKQQARTLVFTVKIASAALLVYLVAILLPTVLDGWNIYEPVFYGIGLCITILGAIFGFNVSSLFQTRWEARLEQRIVSKMLRTKPGVDYNLVGSAIE